MSANGLSGLPDDVICRILSFLPTRCCVRTSVLSKEWRYLWSHVPSLGFTCSEYYCTQCCTETVDSISKMSNTNIFHRGFAGATNRRDDELESWIASLFSTRSVRSLVVGPNCSLPRRLFTCDTLVELRIVGCAIMDGNVRFPALKKLQLVNVGYEYEESLPHLLSGCPVLDELIVHGMTFSEASRSKFEAEWGPFSRRLAQLCNVYSPTLNKLEIDIDEPVMVGLGDNPALRYLRLRLGKAKHFIGARRLHSLVEADVDLNGGKFEYSLYVNEFVCQLCDVQRLTFSTGRMEDLHDFVFYDIDVKFHNLTELVFRGDWRYIVTFLENAYNLRVLKIHCTAGDHSAPYWIEPNQMPRCFTSHLETVHLVDFGWSTEHEFNMVKYILRNSKVLKMMELHTQLNELDAVEKLETLEKLRLFERGSPTCQIV